MCKRDIESAKVAPESVLSNTGESRRQALDQAFANPPLDPKHLTSRGGATTYKGTNWHELDTTSTERQHWPERN